MIQRSNQLLAAYQRAALLLPEFLVPSLASTRTSKTFSTAFRCRSRIGSAPLSLPAEVELEILEPALQRKKEVTKTELPRTVQVKGPLGTRNCINKHTLWLTLSEGKMTVQLPPYMSLDHNKETRKATLSILDREERKQREMWGMITTAVPFICPINC